MNTYALPALKDKRAKIAGEIIAMRRQIERHRKSLISIDATIAIFDPDYKVGSIKPINPRNRAKIFKLGELGRLTIDALRRADGRPLSRKEISDAVIADSKTDSIAGKRTVAKSVGINLSYMARRGKLIKTGWRDTAKWALLPD